MQVWCVSQMSSVPMSNKRGNKWENIAKGIRLTIPTLNFKEV